MTIVAAITALTLLGVVLMVFVHACAAPDLLVGLICAVALLVFAAALCAAWDEGTRSQKEDSEHG